MLHNKNQQETNYLTFYYSDPLSKHFIARHLNKGADINGNNSYNSKSLLTIVTEGYINQGRYSLDIVHYLLTRGANPFLRDGNKNSMLSIAAKNGSVQLLKIIIERVETIKDVYKISTLKNAIVSEIIQHSYSNKVLCLIRRSGVDPNYKIPQICGKTLMHMAAEFGHIKHFLVLLRMRGRVDVEDNYGNTSLNIIKSGTNKNFFCDISRKKILYVLSLIELNLKHYQSITEGQLFELKGCIKSLTEKSANQNSTNKLVSLCCTNVFNKTKVTELIEGANINGTLKNHTRNAYNGKRQLTRLVELYSDQGTLDGKRAQNIPKMIQKVINCGADLSKQDDCGNSAISLTGLLNTIQNALIVEGKQLNNSSCAQSEESSYSKKRKLDEPNQPETSMGVGSIGQLSTSRGHGGK